jgi:hypothetical protein
MALASADQHHVRECAASGATAPRRHCSVSGGRRWSGSVRAGRVTPGRSGRCWPEHRGRDQEGHLRGLRRRRAVVPGARGAVGRASCQATMRGGRQDPADRRVHREPARHHRGDGPVPRRHQWPGRRSSRPGSPAAEPLGTRGHRDTLTNAAAFLPSGPAGTAAHDQAGAAGAASGGLDAAAASLRTGRDLLHTHFRTGPDGARRDHSEWAPVIASVPVTRALLLEIGSWARR